MFDAVLVANRGEIACRVLATLRALEIRSVAVHTEADADAAHVAAADEAVLLGPEPLAYLDAARVLEAAARTGAQAVHPGYGFLAEDPGFAQAVLDAGLAWVGPDPATMAALGDKIAARALVAGAGVAVAPGTTEPVVDADAAVAAAATLGYPLVVKPSGGGGGIGIGVAADEAELRAAVATALARTTRAFGATTILLERLVPRARHVEVQLLGLADGRVLALGDRECSVQRRHQKIVEEAPAPGLGPTVRSRLHALAVAAGQAAGYRGAGTAEFLLDPATGELVFLEVNARLQVEHPVTELVTGLDLVAEQLRVAAGDAPGFDPTAPPQPSGHAFEVRVCAEDPRRFLPRPGTITRWQQPAGEGVRVDAGYREGDVVSSYYDSLLAKLCVWAPDRAEALRRLQAALGGFVVGGPAVNLPFLAELCEDAAFRSGEYDTGIVGRMRP